MFARVLVLTLAVLLAGFALIERHEARTCQDRADRLLNEVLDADAAGRERLVDELLDRCEGSHLIAVAANGLAGAGRGLSGQAVELADEAIEREPRNYEGWAALSAALRRRGLDEAAARALREVRRLNPLFGRAPG